MSPENHEMVLGHTVRTAPTSNEPNKNVATWCGFYMSAKQVLTRKLDMTILHHAV
jgi:hypothetical protein